MGSSPRVRGKPFSMMNSSKIIGLIPARAGKTGPGSGMAHAGGAHPRACGENLPGPRHPTTPLGSSPRVRGKRQLPQPRRQGTRLIPARAGKTDWRPAATRRQPAHPRACGENAAQEVFPGPRPGSSPRVRGKRVGQRFEGPADRLIPARAGKTRSRSRRAGPVPAHPRACGENHGLGPGGGPHLGSSPRVRGKLGRVLLPERRGGLIPARAGKTRPGGPLGCARPAHPRACGENFVNTALPTGTVGSSPRVRGKPEDAPVPDAPGGLIPARAGKTG